MALPGSWQHLLAGCDPAQAEAITSPAAPLLVVAAAGSGKTRVLTRRIAWRIAHEQAAPRHVLALTFTRKAAGELRGRLAALGLPSPVTAGTFHAVALAQLRRHAIERGRRPPVVLDTKARLLGPLAARILPGGGGQPASMPRGGRQELLAGLATEIEWAKGRLAGPGEYAQAARAAGRTPPVGPDTLATLYAAYEEDRRRRGLVDFDDLLLDLIRVIEDEPDFAAAQRWQFAHLFVDELQDATTLQLRLVDAWLAARPDLFAVGDPRQSVFGFNGADPDAVTGFSTRHAGATVVELATNYRSSPQVVALAAAALPGRFAATPPRSGRPDGAVPHLQGYADDATEAAAVAAFLRRAHRPGRAWSACAVLARTNGQLAVLEQALIAAGVPTSRPGAGGPLEHPAARAVLDELPRDLDGGRLVAYLAERAAELPDAVESPGDGGGALAPAREAAAALAGLVELADDYLALDSVPTSAGFLAFLRTGGRDARLPGRDAVELVTFHRAKGLEWEVVCVTGLEDGLVPIAHARDEAGLEEERRLLYVALTRATDELHCSWASERQFGTRRVARTASPWLSALESARARLSQRPARATVAAALAASRAVLAASATTDNPRPEVER